MIDSYNIIDVDENSLNHYRLSIPTASLSVLQRYDPVVFTKDTIIAKLRVFGAGNGWGEVDVLNAANNPVFAVAFERDTTITDTLRTVQPKRVFIFFDRYSGSFEFQMD